MPLSASARHALVGPNGATDAIALGDNIINAIITRLEATGAGFKQGTSRPAASSALQGYVYFHTGTGTFSYCTGTGWADINAGIALSRLADPGAGKVVGSSGGAAAAVYPPGYEIGYDRIIDNVTGIDDDTESVVVDVTATFDGGLVIAEFFAPLVYCPSGGYVQIFLDGVGQIAQVTSNDAIGCPVLARVRMTPSAGSHTYTVTALSSGTSNIIYCGGGTGEIYVPAYLRFTKV